MSLEYHPTCWPLVSFGGQENLPDGSRGLHTIHGVQLHFDRANGEFGILFPQPNFSAIMAQFDDNRPICFLGAWAQAACTRTNNSCKKVSVLLPACQLDFEFENVKDIPEFCGLLEKLSGVGFVVYEVYRNVAFQRNDFDMRSLGYVGNSSHKSANGPDSAAETLQRLWKTSEYSDFSIIAGQKIYKVHRAILGPRSSYFGGICNGNFAEGEDQSIHLPEDEITVGAMLAEVYGVGNSITQSMFLNFALLPEMKKESMMESLLKLFIAADKYAFDCVKVKAAQALADRLPLIQDHWTIVELASRIYSEDFPPLDFGLGDIFVAHTQERLDAIIEEQDEGEIDGPKVRLQENTNLSWALIKLMRHMIKSSDADESTSSGKTPSPQTSPYKVRKTKHW